MRKTGVSRLPLYSGHLSGLLPAAVQARLHPPDEPRQGSGGHARRLPLRSGRRWILVNQVEIKYIEADGNTVKIHARAGCLKVRTGLGEIEKQLDQALFFKCHRGYIVNVEEITEIRPSGRTYVIVLRSGEELLLSRRRRDQLFDRLGGSR